MNSTIQVRVRFWSYFKDFAGCAERFETVPVGTTLGALHERVLASFPRLVGTRHCTLLAIGHEYAPRDRVLQEGDEISLFPPVQGG